jgi:hypothetical protein
MFCFRCFSKKKTKKVSIAIQHDPKDQIIDTKQPEESTFTRQPLQHDSYNSLNSSHWIKSASNDASVSETSLQESKSSDFISPVRRVNKTRATVPPVRATSLAQLKNNHKRWKDPKDIFRQSNLITDKMQVYARANMYNLK